MVGGVGGGWGGWGGEREFVRNHEHHGGSKASPAHSLRITIRISKGIQGRADVKRERLVFASKRRGRRMRAAVFVLHVYTHSAVTLSHATVHTPSCWEFLDLCEKRQRRVPSQNRKGK